MELKIFLKDKFDYNFNRNEELIKILLEKPNCFKDKVSLLFCHSLNAHEVWNSRMLNRTYKFKVWDIHELHDLQEINNKLIIDSCLILETIDLEKEIEYRTFDQQNFRSKVCEMLFHVINHSTYHRGQIYQLLKADGVQPPFTDYIFHTRKSI